MKSKFVIITALLLAICPFMLSAGSAEENSQMAWVGKINSKTWVVTSVTVGDLTSHFEPGDAFRMADIRNVKRFVPFPALLGKLNAKNLSEAPGEDAYIPLTLLVKEENKSGQPQKRQQHFCGLIEFKSHEKTGPMEHIMQIQVIDKSNLDIVLQEYSDEAWHQCTSFSSHGGIVHAKN